jgi:hypothetical protein
MIQPDPENDDEAPAPKARGRPRKTKHDEHDEDIPAPKPRDRPGKAPRADPEAGGITASSIRGDIVGLVNQSMQVSENVAEYMRVTDKVEESDQIDIDVDAALEQRRNKRQGNAKEKEGGAKKSKTKK